MTFSFQVKKEIDTDKFSFEALMTMNTAKVKSKKKKKELVDESDTSCLQFSAPTPGGGIKLAASGSNGASEKEMTDREAAFLATSRKKGGGAMMGGRKKTKMVTKVYRLYDMAEKMLTNHPQYLLACMHHYLYSAQLIMPALERLDEKTLHKVLFKQRRLCH